jgi:hypothetical protein
MTTDVGVHVSFHCSAHPACASSLLTLKLTLYYQTHVSEYAASLTGRVVSVNSP